MVNVPSIEDISSIIQLVSHCCTVDLHASCEHHQVIPLRYNVEEKVDVRSLVNEKSYGMTINDHRDLQRDQSRLWTICSAPTKWKFSASIFMSSSFHKPALRLTRFLLNEKLIFVSELTVKSCGVPGLIDGLRGRPSWCEWISVSSRSSTSVLRWTKVRRCRETEIENFLLTIKANGESCTTDLVTTDTDRTWPADIEVLFWTVCWRDTRRKPIICSEAEKSIESS